jgi:hypothetical protein
VFQLTVWGAGVHQVSDVYCVCCGCYMGWQYVDAEDADQKYKIGQAACVAAVTVALTLLLSLNSRRICLLLICFAGKSVLEMAKLEKISRE